jgi:hypothetical protein
MGGDLRVSARLLCSNTDAFVVNPLESKNLLRRCMSDWLKLRLLNHDSASSLNRAGENKTKRFNKGAVICPADGTRFQSRSDRTSSGWRFLLFVGWFSGSTALYGRGLTRNILRATSRRSDLISSSSAKLRATCFRNSITAGSLSTGDTVCST